jgi:hypothetical protein
MPGTPVPRASWGGGSTNRTCEIQYALINLSYRSFLFNYIINHKVLKSLIKLFNSITQIKLSCISNGYKSS